MEKTHNKEQSIYGLRPIIEAIESGTRIDRIMLQTGLSGQLATTLKSMASSHGVPMQYVPIEKLNKLTTGNHQGAVAIIATIEYKDFMQVATDLTEQERVPFIVMLDHITDVRNMGAIARTAECAGVDALVIPQQGSARISDDAVKTSSGALLRIPVCREANLKTVVNIAKQYGMQIVAATEKGHTNYREVDFKQPTLLIMGSEETGISNELLRLCDTSACLPVCGAVASLNVSVAAGIFMYEVLAQRS